MKDVLITQLEHSKNALKYWWMILILGVTLFAIGVLIFAYPVATYLSLTLLFGIAIFFSGLANLALSTLNRNIITSRGWLIAGGIFEMVIGFILMIFPAISAQTLPVFLGFWLLLRSMNLIGMGSDMYSLSIPGSGWNLFTGILLMICSLVILFQPLLYGTEAVVIWVGVSFLVAGVSAFTLALQLKGVHKHFNR